MYLRNTTNSRRSIFHVFQSSISISVYPKQKKEKYAHQTSWTRHQFGLGRWSSLGPWSRGPSHCGCFQNAFSVTRVFLNCLRLCVLVLRYDHFAQLLRELDVMLCPQVSQLLCSFYRIVLYTSLGKTKKPTDGRKGGTHAVISKNKHSSSACMIKIYCNFTAILRFSQYEHSTENECKSQAKPTEWMSRTNN